MASWTGVKKTSGSWGGSKPSGGGTGYQDMLSRLAEEFRPGGTVEKTRLKEAEVEAKRLGARLDASAVSRGLGNAILPTESIVEDRLSRDREGIRAQTLGQYLNTLQFLAQLQFQGEQAGASRAAAMSTPGVDAFGEPLSGSAAGQQFRLVGQQIRQQQRQFQLERHDKLSQLFPGLAAAGGMGAEDISTAPSLFGDGGAATSAPTHVRWSQPLYGNPEAESKSGSPYRMM